MTDLSKLRIAIVHYWLINRRGGERVVEVLADMFPQAEIFTLLLDRSSLAGPLRTRRITPSSLQKLPGVNRYYRKLLPLFPMALEQFRLNGYDLIVSSESGPAKGVITPASTCHICYCHSPMRYLWDLFHQYKQGKGVGPLSRVLFTLSAHYVRMWDLATASRVDYFVANSENVALRIRKHYRREAKVINPPVEVSAGWTSSTLDDYYLVVSQLVDYKRVDLAIEACNRLRRPLRVVGDGEEYKRLRRLAGPTVQFLGFLPDETVRENYARCRALLFPGEEDFGMVPVEAHSFGRPVIAYGRGGALETVDGFFVGEPPRPEVATGIFFRQQSVESLVDAMRAFESVEKRFSPPIIRAHAQRFDVSRFKKEMIEFIENKLTAFRRQNTSSAAVHHSVSARMRK
jgi:glycosyltransferase involved in cell wall biosynthesis